MSPHTALKLTYKKDLAMASLFTPYTLKGVTLRNRIVASPMCQYQSCDGMLNEWHQSHYEMLARGGVGLVIVEATAVSPRGRITLGDAGLWSDLQTPGFEEVAHAIKQYGAVAGLQIGHAWRKAGCTPPWEGGMPLPESAPQAWQPVAPSALAYSSDSQHAPTEITLEEIQRTQNDFASAARRAAEAGFQWLELHFVHGFLGQNFLSNSANARTDLYGGSLENRARFLIETVVAVKHAWPAHLPLAVRLGVVEFGGCAETTFAESIQVLRWLKAAGVDVVDVSLNLTEADEPVPWAANFLVPYASRVRAQTGMAVGTSWMISDPLEADAFVRDGQLDLVCFARTLLANPHWPFHAARALNVTNPSAVLPTPYAYWLKQWVS